MLDEYFEFLFSRLFFSGLYKAKNRLSRTFSFSPISSKNRLKKMLTSNSSLLHLNDKDNNNFNSMKRLSVPSRQDSFTSERNFPQSPSRFMHSIQECKPKHLVSKCYFVFLL
jgi:hypothetical protein